MLMAVPATAGEPAFVRGIPQPMFKTGMTNLLNRQYDVGPRSPSILDGGPATECFADHATPGLAIGGSMTAGTHHSRCESRTQEAFGGDAVSRRDLKVKISSIS
jgi:hypothetical protein